MPVLSSFSGYGMALKVNGSNLTRRGTRMPLSPLRYAKVTGALSVKGLAPVFFGLVFYRRLAGCRQAENSPKFGNGFGA